MSSTLPSRNNDYRFPPAPAKAVFDRATADHIHGDIGARLRAVEAKRTELQELLNDLSFNAQARVDATISPIIAAAQADLAGLAQEVAETLDANQQIIDNFQAVTAVNLVDLENKIAEVEQRIAVILAGGIAAADVAVSPARLFVTEEEKQEIADLRGEVDDISGSLVPATATSAGLMIAGDKAKLDSLHSLANALNLHFGS